MSKPTNKNSILVLATLGVYFGLVLVGATPQVLAQAAMTREFSVKDEIEVKDDLDTKPDLQDETAAATSEDHDKNIARSVERFLSRFHPSTVNPTLFEAPASSFDFAAHRLSSAPQTLPTVTSTFLTVNSILTITNFPRADLDHPSAI